MEPRIETISEKKLVGRKVSMSISQNRTVELWQSFMPKRNEIKNSLSPDLFCVQVYDSSLDFKEFNTSTLFDKWASKEVSSFVEIPDTMETFVLEGGLYAVFLYRGASSDFEPVFHYIFGEWIPNSIYEVDKRPHFEILGAKYKNNAPDSEEEIWIPIKIKTRVE